MADSLPPDSFPEKRTFRRYARWFPVTLRVGEQSVWAICRDASEGGILVSSSMPVEIGLECALSFKIRPSEPAEHIVHASVVRAETNDDELMLAFPFRIGLRFVKPVPELLDELQRASEKVPL
jgi:hypothetical protein